MIAFKFAIVATVFLTFLAPGPTFACGSVFKSFNAKMLEADKEGLTSFLTAHTGNEPAKYSPNKADQYIAVVLLHAIEAEVPVAIVESVFAKYHCVAQLTPHSAHRRIVDYIGGERVQELCPEDELRRIFIVAADGGANLRTGPTPDSPKIGAISDGLAVESGVIEGDWILVDTFMGTGYMHRSTLRRYLPEKFD